MNLPSAWEAWVLLGTVLLGAMPLVLQFPWRLASVLPVGVASTLLIIGAEKQRRAQRG